MERKSIIKPNEKSANKRQPNRRPIPNQENTARNPFLLRENQKRKRKPGTNVLMEIRSLQQSSDNLIPFAPFQKMVKEICEENYNENYRWTTLAVKALQTSAENYMIGLFEDAYLCSMHCKRVTLLAKDMQLARRIRGVNDPGNGR